MTTPDQPQTTIDGSPESRPAGRSRRQLLIMSAGAVVLVAGAATAPLWWRRLIGSTEPSRPKLVPGPIIPQVIANSLFTKAVATALGVDSSIVLNSQNYQAISDKDTQGVPQLSKASWANAERTTELVLWLSPRMLNANETGITDYLAYTKSRPDLDHSTLLDVPGTLDTRYWGGTDRNVTMILDDIFLFARLAETDDGGETPNPVPQAEQRELALLKTLAGLPQ
jgi:hypothetical protein